MRWLVKWLWFACLVAACASEVDHAIPWPIENPAGPTIGRFTNCVIGINDFELLEYRTDKDVFPNTPDDQHPPWLQTRCAVETDAYDFTRSDCDVTLSSHSCVKYEIGRPSCTIKIDHWYEWTSPLGPSRRNIRIDFSLEFSGADRTAIMRVTDELSSGNSTTGGECIVTDLLPGAKPRLLSDEDYGP